MDFISSREIRRLKPLVRHACQCIHQYQLHRSVIHEIRMRESIQSVCSILISRIPVSDSRLIKLLQRQAHLSPSALIIGFDQLIRELHMCKRSGPHAAENSGAGSRSDCCILPCPVVKVKDLRH